MKSLRDYKLRVETPAGTVSNRIAWGGAFPTPIHGTVNGLPVRAIMVGDLPGASTVILCAGPDGTLGPVKEEDFRVTDGNYLPLIDTPAQERTTTGATIGRPRKTT